MKLVRWIFCFLPLASSVWGEVDANGWAFVERPEKAPFEEGREEDLGIWVLFSKKMESETFLVRLPEDPSYVYLPGDGIELFSSQEGWTYRLVVEKKEGKESLEKRKGEIEAKADALLIEAVSPSPGCLDLFYQEGGKWVWERLFQSEHYLYFFQTKSEFPFVENHRLFVESLDVYPS